jgi:hypothetical protein
MTPSWLYPVSGCMNLELMFSKRYVVTMEGSWDAETPVNRAEFLEHGEGWRYQEISGKRGWVYTFSESELAVVLPTRATRWTCSTGSRKKRPCRSVAAATGHDGKWRTSFVFTAKGSATPIGRRRRNKRNAEYIRTLEACMEDRNGRICLSFNRIVAGVVRGDGWGAEGER